MDYFYDSQIRRFLIQFAKMFSMVQVTRGKDPSGNNILVRIPIQYGNASRMVASIQSNNSASSLPSAPMLTYYISGLEYDQKRTQEPYFIDKMQVRQRKYNSETQTYETTQGQAFTIERPMPVPYTLRITLDLWTTNEQQKHEFIEQMGTLFNPSWEIQSTDNYIDWTSLSVVYQDGLTYSSRSVPAGTNNPIDILTWKFYLPIWLSQPIKLKKMGVVNKIIASIFKGKALDDIQDDDLLLGTRQKITPYGYKLLLQCGTVSSSDGTVPGALQLYPNNTAMYPPNSSLDEPQPEDTKLTWGAYLNMYGAIRPGISQIWLQNPWMETEIIGTITQDPLDDRVLLYKIDADTLPQDTLDDVNAVINPLVNPPTDFVVGTRYLIVESIGNDASKITVPGNLLGGMSPLNDLQFVITSTNNGSIVSVGEFEGIGTPASSTSTSASINYRITIPGNPAMALIEFTKSGNVNQTNYAQTITANVISGGSGFTVNSPTPLAWGNCVANANDIIQCVAVDPISKVGTWVVAFDSAAEISNLHYVTNSKTGIQYRWTEGMWMKSVEGWYAEGDFSIVI